jgi:acetyltransferase-like isoleucine patch superfamily enzyme
MIEQLKGVLRALALVAVSPLLLWFSIKRQIMDPDRALQGSAQALALLPGLPGLYIRRAFLSMALERCASTSVVEFGVTFSRAGARLDDRVYVGSFCNLGLVHLEQDVLIASGVHIPSGPETHGSELVDIAIRDQPGRRQRVRVGAGSWVGSGAIVMADVGRNCIIGAGAVVTSPIPDRSVAVGVPARVIRVRGDS